MRFIPSETDVRNTQYKIEDAPDHYFYQDSTAPFFLIGLIQKFGVSNPTPKYVKDVDTAFKNREYNSNSMIFDEGRYMDINTTISAVLFH